VQVFLGLGFMDGEDVGGWDGIGWRRFWLAESSCLSFYDE
jgi:hypothetical protein